MRGKVFVVVIVGSLVAALGAPIVRAAPSPIWRRAPGGALEAVVTGAHDSIYVTGQLRGGARIWSLVVAKYAANGGQRWRRTWRVPRHDWNATGESLAAAPDGGVYVGGSSGYGEGGDALLLRYASNGRLLWERTLPTHEGRAHIVGLAARGGRVVAAVADAGCCATWDHDAYVQAFGADGALLWRTDFEVRGVHVGTWDSVAGLAMGANGRSFVAGEVDRGIWEGDPAPLPDEDIAIQALGPTGRVLWTKVISDGRSGRDWDQATDIDVRGDLVVVTGMAIVMRRQEPRAWVGAFDTDGHHHWTRRWGGGERFRSATAVAIARWGGVYVGTALSPLTGPAASSLRRYDRGGGFVWTRVLGTVRGGFVNGIATSGSVYLTLGRQLQRWRH